MKQLDLFQIDNLQMRPPLRYPGSKYGALKIINKYLPKTNISDYCEPFFGSGAFYFKNVKSDAKIILNDYDKNLINFYQIIKDKKNINKFYKIVSKFKPSKKNFDGIKTKLFSNNFDKAVQYFIINRTAYSGIMNKPNWGYHPERSVQPHKWSERIKLANSKLLNTTNYTQISIFAASIGIYKTLESNNDFVSNLPKIRYMLGHSLGEYSALAASNSLSLSQASILLKKRGELMNSAVSPNSTSMAALIGMNCAKIDWLIMSSG